MAYNRFNVSILCVADSEDDVELYGSIKKALNALPKVSVKIVNLDLWQDGATGRTREFDEEGKEIFPVEPVVEEPAPEETTEPSEEPVPELSVENV